MESNSPSISEISKSEQHTFEGTILFFNNELKYCGENYVNLKENFCNCKSLLSLPAFFLMPKFIYVYRKKFEPLQEAHG